MTARFDSPQTIVTGGGCRAQAADLLSAMRAHRALLVVDPYFASAEFVMQIRSDLERKGIASDLFTDLQPDPTDQNVTAGTERFRCRNRAERGHFVSLWREAVKAGNNGARRVGLARALH